MISLKNKLTGLALAGMAMTSTVAEAKEMKDTDRFPDLVIPVRSVEKSETQKLAETLVAAQEKFKKDIMDFRALSKECDNVTETTPASSEVPLLEKESISGIEDVASLLQLKPAERVDMLKKLSEKKVPIYVPDEQIIVLISGMTPKQTAEISKIKTSFDEDGNCTIGEHIKDVVDHYQATGALVRKFYNSPRPVDDHPISLCPYSGRGLGR